MQSVESFLTKLDIFGPITRPFTGNVSRSAGVSGPGTLALALTQAISPSDTASNRAAISTRRSRCGSKPQLHRMPPLPSSSRSRRRADRRNVSHPLEKGPRCHVIEAHRGCGHTDDACDLWVSGSGYAVIAFYTHELHRFRAETSEGFVTKPQAIACWVRTSPLEGHSRRIASSISANTKGLGHLIRAPI